MRGLTSQKSGYLSGLGPLQDIKDFPAHHAHILQERDSWGLATPPGGATVLRFLHQHHILGEAPASQKVCNMKLLGEESPWSWHRPDESGAHVKPRWATVVGPGLLWAPEMGKELKC